jgi:hypothetical protein
MIELLFPLTAFTAADPREGRACLAGVFPAIRERI